MAKRVDPLIAMLHPVFKEHEPPLATNWAVNSWIRDAMPERAKEVSEQLQPERKKSR